MEKEMRKVIRKFSAVFLCWLVLLAACVATSGCPSLASDIALVETLATSFGSLVAVVAPQDAAAIAVINTAIRAAANAVQGCYNAYIANKTATTLQDLLACGEAVLTGLPQTLAGVRILDQRDQLFATAGVNLFLDAIQAYITFEGGTTALTLPNGRGRARATGPIVAQGDKKGLGRELKRIRTEWNIQVCSGSCSI